jgi:hypothetical protein
MHPVETDSAWSESYYFNGYDPGCEAGLYTRVGIRPHEGTMDVMLAVWLPDGGVAFARAVRDQTEMTESPLEVGGLTYRCLERGARWSLSGTCDAQAYGPGRQQRDCRVRLDLTFDALTPLIGVEGGNAASSGESAAASTATGKGHLEQAGRWSGGVEVDGVVASFGPEARGNRDKSWGPRRWGGPRMWRWFSINIGDETHFGGIRIGTEAGDLHRGWVWTEGALTSLAEWRVRTETQADGVTQKRVWLTAVDKAGREHALEGEVLRVFPGGAKAGETRVNEGLTRWRYGGRTGYGIAEYLHQFNNAGEPAVAIE